MSIVRARLRTSAAVVLSSTAALAGASCVNLSTLDRGSSRDAMVEAPGGDAGADALGAPEDGGTDGAGVTTSLAAGGLHACAIRNGAVYCWGSNGNGQLGPTASCEAGRCAVPQKVQLVDGSATPVEVAAGLYHTCARLADDTMQCWGDNSAGELGLGPLVPTTPSGLVFAPGTPFVQFALGYDDSCAASASGSAYCWGENGSGQLGTGEPMKIVQPTAISNLAGVQEVGLGYTWACARLMDGGVDCWGSNATNEQPCDSGAVCSSTPVPIAGLDGVDGGVVRLSVGNASACAIMADSSVRCWGYNGHGELGDSTNQPSAAAVNVQYVTSQEPVRDVVDLGSGASGNCAVLSDGGVACWGATPYSVNSPLAYVVPTPPGVRHIALGTNGEYQPFGCLLFEDGGVSCVGDNTYNELGRTDCDAGAACPLAPVVDLP